MKDVIQNPLQNETASWTPGKAKINSGSDSDIVARPTLPYPLSGIFNLVDSHKNYSKSCRDLAEFLKTECNGYPLEETILQVVSTRFSRVWMERFLFILLEVKTSDWQTAEYVLQFRHLKRLLLRIERHKPLNISETALARELIETLGLSNYTDIEPFCVHAENIFKKMQAGEIPVSGDLGLLLYLIRCESVSMAERKNWLESNLNSGDPSSVAKITPHLKLLEDRLQRAQEMAARLGGYGPVIDSPMGFEEAMGPFFFAYFKDSIAAVPELAPFRKILGLQQEKRVPTKDLISLSTLCRWIFEAREIKAGPLDWIQMALESYEQGHFKLTLESGHPAVEALLQEARVERDGDEVFGNFGEDPYSSWIARDELTRPYRSSNPNRTAPDLRSLLFENMHRENIILKLLDHPKVHLTPGLIEAVVEAIQLESVHTKIASQQELHTGPINGLVPIALLKSKVNISAEILRNLIHPQFISFTNMKSIYRTRDLLRPQVVEGLGAFLKQAYSV